MTLGKMNDSTQRFRRGSGDGMYAQGNLTQHGKPDTMDARDIQPVAREGQAGSFRVADRLAVPMTPGNAGKGKGP
jgi:hypothetical protein